MAGNARLRRVTDLFVRGTEVEVGDGVLVWVNKPNAFEREEADRDARAARQRKLLSLHPDRDSVEPEPTAAARAAAETLEESELVAGAVASKRASAYLLALDDIKADEAWQDDIELLERGDALLADGAAVIDEAEGRALADLNARYMTAVQERFLARMADHEAELDGWSRDQLVNAYLDTWRAQLGLEAFERERWATTLYYALRECNATKDASGKWDHRKCRHLRLLDSRSEVAELPDGLRELVEPALRNLLMSPAEAGNSAAPTNSSASLEQHAEPEASTPSTPSDE